MLERGDWVVPHFNGQHRFDKPPLIYWAQASAMRWLGQNEFAARLPSALAAAGAAVLLFFFAGRFSRSLGDPQPNRVAGWTALTFTFSLQVIVHAKAAVADMALIFFLTLGFWAAWEVGRDRKRFGWWLALVLAMGLGFLAKGPLAWLPVLLMGLQLAHCKVGWGGRLGLPAVALFLSLLPVALWGLPALAATQGEFFKIGIGKHVIERGLAAQEGHGSSNLLEYLVLLPFYFITVFISFYPWSPSLPGWIRTLRQGGQREEYPLFWTVIFVFVLFSLYKTKLPHYTLPAFPLLAILLVRHLVASGRSDEWFQRRMGLMALVVVAVMVVAPFAKELFPSREIARLAAPHVAGDGEFGAIGFREPSLVWYMRGNTSAFMKNIKPEEAVRFLSRPGKRVLILPAALGAEIQGLESFPLVGQVAGVNLALGRRVTLHIYSGVREALLD